MDLFVGIVLVIIGISLWPKNINGDAKRYRENLLRLIAHYKFPYDEDFQNRSNWDPKLKIPLSKCTPEALEHLRRCSELDDGPEQDLEYEYFRQCEMHSVNRGYIPNGMGLADIVMRLPEKYGKDVVGRWKYLQLRLFYKPKRPQFPSVWKRERRWFLEWRKSDECLKSIDKCAKLLKKY